MALPVLVALVGLLVAVVATGVLAGRCIREPRACFIVRTVGALGLAVALAAQAMGLANGFGPVTFRAIQVGAQLIAPLWLAWGLVELVARAPPCWRRWHFDWRFPPGRHTRCCRRWQRRRSGSASAGIWRPSPALVRGA